MMFFTLVPIYAWAQNSSTDKSESGKQLEIIIGVIIFILIGVILLTISKNKKVRIPMEIVQTNVNMRKPESINIPNNNKIEKNYPPEIYANTKESFIHDEKVQWTLEMIKKLQEENIGNSIMLNMIGKSLTDGKYITNVELNYLKEKHLVLKKIRKIKWTIDLIRKLQEHKIGDTAKLDVIKNALEDGKPVNNSEIDYLKEKFGQLTILLKSNKINNNTIKS